MDLDEDAQPLRVSVVFSPRAGEVEQIDLVLARGATVADALAQSGLQSRHPEFDLAVLPTGIWGALCGRGDALRDRDRVELYRPLRVDPKQARRERYQTQRSKPR